MSFSSSLSNSFLPDMLLTKSPIFCLSHCNTIVESSKKLWSAFDEPMQPTSSSLKNTALKFSIVDSSDSVIYIPTLSSPPIPYLCIFTLSNANMLSSICITTTLSLMSCTVSIWHTIVGYSSALPFVTYILPYLSVV